MITISFSTGIFAPLQNHSFNYRDSTSLLGASLNCSSELHQCCGIEDSQRSLRSRNEELLVAPLECRAEILPNLEKMKRETSFHDFRTLLTSSSYVIFCLTSLFIDSIHSDSRNKTPLHHP